MKNFKEYLTGVPAVTESTETIPMMAIDYVDDLLAQLNEEEQYGVKGDMFRYILSRLQK